MNEPLALSSPVADPPRRWRWTWLWPFLLALAFSGAVSLWLVRAEQLDREEQQRNIISDALSLSSRIEDWIHIEQATLQALAAKLNGHINDITLLNQPAVVEGLRRVWVSVTVVDENNRQIAHVPQFTPPVRPLAGQDAHEDISISTHLIVPLPHGGQVIARMDPATLLRKSIPWWLSRKYEVQLIDDYGQRLAGTGEPLAAKGRQSYRIDLSPELPNTFLELTTRDPYLPWWRSLPMLFIGVFLVLSAVASWALRQQMQVVDQARQRWRDEAAWRQAIEASLMVGLRARDTEGRVVHVNRAFCDLVGFSQEQLVGQLPPMPYWLPDTIEESMKRHQRNLAGQAPREGYETQFRRADGTVIDVMMFETPWVDASGRQIGWMGSFVDIRAAKQAQERERRQMEALAKQARLTTLGEVASALAHQLNQPLAAVAGYNAGILHTLEHLEPRQPELLEALRESCVQIEEAGRVVQRIRGFLTRQAPQRESCDLSQIVQRAVALLRRDLKDKGIALELDCPGGLPAVWGDPVLLEQVLINLVRNAMDAQTDQPHPRIAVAIRPTDDEHLLVRVDDNGPGVEGQTIDELASPFHTSKPQGMGMGLAICRSVVEAHHGTLRVAPNAWGGSRFSFTVPTVGMASDT